MRVRGCCTWLVLAVYFTGVGALQAKTIEVRIDNMAYVPSSIMAEQGDMIRWINNDPFDHTATVEGRWEVMIQAGATIEQPLEKPEFGNFLLPIPSDNDRKAGCDCKIDLLSTLSLSPRGRGRHAKACRVRGRVKLSNSLKAVRYPSPASGLRPSSPSPTRGEGKDGHIFYSVSFAVLAGSSRRCRCTMKYRICALSMVSRALPSQAVCAVA